MGRSTEWGNQRVEPFSTLQLWYSQHETCLRDSLVDCRNVSREICPWLQARNGRGKKSKRKDGTCLLPSVVKATRWLMLVHCPMICCYIVFRTSSLCQSYGSITIPKRLQNGQTKCNRLRRNEWILIFENSFVVLEIFDFGKVALSDTIPICRHS